VVLGIRPEHLTLGRGELLGTVQLVEPMGNHHVVWIAFAGHTLAAVAHEDPRLQPDDGVRFGFDLQRLSLFDRRTEQRL
jgi:multiple sugar transport system ATP-binding protein